MKKIVIALLGIILSTLTFKTVAQTPPGDKSEKCEAEALLGGSCKVTCPEGSKANCHAGILKAKCNCIKAEAYSVPATINITAITKEDIEGLSLELTEKQQKNFDELHSFIKEFNEKVAEEIGNRYSEIAKHSDSEAYLQNANSIINTLLEMNEEEKSKLVDFFKSTYSIQVSFK